MPFLLGGGESVKNATLKAELARHGIKRRELSQALGLSESALIGKLQGRRSFYLGEACIIERIIKDRGGDIALHELFRESLAEDLNRLVV